MELSPGLHRIGNDIVACYLVVTDDGITLIDAGLPGQWHDLNAELATLGRSLADIRGVVITHGDSDHIGFAERLHQETGAPVYVHEADVARARGEESTSPAWGRMRIGATASFLWYAIRKGRGSKHLTDVIAVHGGETLDLPGSPRIIPLPGHSPGSIAIHVASVDAVFVGDGLTTRHVLTGTTGPAPAPFTDEPAEALTSLDAIAELGVAWVLPGHGAPWNKGSAEAVRLVRTAADL